MIPYVYVPKGRRGPFSLFLRLPRGLEPHLAAGWASRPAAWLEYLVDDL